MREKKESVPDKAMAARMMKSMMTGRKFEEKVQWLFAQGLVHGTTHLGIGEEATSTGSVLALTDDDYLFTTHRGHSQVVARGVDLNAMMAEILARATGICGGKGGSMHLTDFNKGILGSSGVLGSAQPIACGAAFYAKRKHPGKRVCLCFYGDGASNLGGVHEAMNLAAAWDLPLLFVLVNNTYGMSTPLSKAVRETDLVKRAAAYGMPGYTVDGNDVAAVFNTVRQARRQALKEGPVLIVENTYRISGHSKSDGNLYRTKEEMNAWRERCPIKRFKQYVLDNALMTQAEIDELDKETAKAIEAAVEFAKNSPEPSLEELLTDVYA